MNARVPAWGRAAHLESTGYRCIGCSMWVKCRMEYSRGSGSDGHEQQLTTSTSRAPGGPWQREYSHCRGLAMAVLFASFEFSDRSRCLRF